jgi:hypothetical protein
VRSLSWLIKLLRVPKKDDASRGLADRKNIRKRHLSSLVHHKYINCIRVVAPRPEPRSSADHIRFPIPQRSDRAIIPSHLHNPRWAWIRHFRYFL